MGSGFLKKKKEMKKLKEQFEKMQSDVKGMEETGEAGHGLVAIKLTGEYRVAEVKLKKECVDPEDVEGLQDLIRVAFNDAVNKIDAKTKNMEGMPYGGGFPF
jgi:DNA-binding YbaB/EbfC family protein